MCDGAFVPETVLLFIERGISVAPVIEDTGRPVRVVSRSDLLMNDCEQSDWSVRRAAGEELPAVGFKVTRMDPTRVHSLNGTYVYDRRSGSPAPSDADDGPMIFKELAPEW